MFVTWNHISIHSVCQTSLERLYSLVELKFCFRIDQILTKSIFIANNTPLVELYTMMLNNQQEQQRLQQQHTTQVLVSFWIGFSFLKPFSHQFLNVFFSLWKITSDYEIFWWLQTLVGRLFQEGALAQPTVNGPPPLQPFPTSTPSPSNQHQTPSIQPNPMPWPRPFGKKLFIGNIKNWMSETRLKTHFSRFGRLSHLQINVTNSGRRKGFGFVQFEELQGARRSVTFEFSISKLNVFLVDQSFFNVLRFLISLFSDLFECSALFIVHSCSNISLSLSVYYQLSPFRQTNSICQLWP